MVRRRPQKPPGMSIFRKLIDRAGSKNCMSTQAKQAPKENWEVWVLEGEALVPSASVYPIVSEMEWC